MGNLVNGWEIKQYRFDDSEVYGLWYVSRRIRLYVWDYLHCDGIVRGGTSNGDQWSGYFDTFEQAEAVAKAFVS